MCGRRGLSDASHRWERELRSEGGAPGALGRLLRRRAAPPRRPLARRAPLRRGGARGAPACPTCGAGGERTGARAAPRHAEGGASGRPRGQCRCADGRKRAETCPRRAPSPRRPSLLLPQQIRASGCHPLPPRRSHTRENPFQARAYRRASLGSPSSGDFVFNQVGETRPAGGPPGTRAGIRRAVRECGAPFYRLVPEKASILGPGAPALPGRASPGAPPLLRRSRPAGALARVPGGRLRVPPRPLPRANPPCPAARRPAGAAGR